jgi:hypothetical protein
MMTLFFSLELAPLKAGFANATRVRTPFRISGFTPQMTP